MAKNRMGLQCYMLQNCQDLKEKSSLSHSRAVADIGKFVSYTRDAGISKASVYANPAAAVQGWVDALKAEGKSPATVHTYAASACRGLGISMSQIKTPPRTVATKSKSNGSCVRAAKERSDPRNARLVEFQQAVGIRRSELGALKGRNLTHDSSGALCVEVERGKGGKYQLQRIAPEDEALVRGYFEGKGRDEPIFSSEEMDCRNLDLHGIRAEHARAEYDRYAEMCQQPGGRERLQQELMDRYEDSRAGCKAYNAALDRGNYAAANKLRENFRSEMEGTYTLRGDNRALAEKKGRPLTYDKTALLAVSVFALSHWRNEVTVKHYMI